MAKRTRPESTTANGRIDRPWDPGRYHAIVGATVQGWFHEPDVRMFCALNWAQRQVGVVGDILEIGTYLGRSAILLGSFLADGENLLVNDLWDDLRVEPDQWDCLTSAPPRAQFVSNYLRFHRQLPRMVVGSSAFALDAESDSRYRITHVDGSHEYEAVRSDVATARRLTTPGGTVIFDDHLNIRHPGVVAAVWGAVDRDELVPQVLTTSKLYASLQPEAVPIEVLEAGAHRYGLEVTHRRCRGHRTLRVHVSRQVSLGALIPPILLPTAKRLRAFLARRVRTAATRRPAAPTSSGSTAERFDGRESGGSNGRIRA